MHSEITWFETHIVPLSDEWWHAIQMATLGEQYITDDQLSLNGGQEAF